MLPARGAPGPWRATLSGLCASLVGIGLARFAYTPLIPALIAARWFDPAQAVYLGAANLAGYLAGALLARSMAARAAAVTILRSDDGAGHRGLLRLRLPAVVLVVLRLALRLGPGGRRLMALAAPTVLPHVPASRRGLAGGAIFTGVGLGIAASGTLVPLLLRLGPRRDLVRARRARRSPSPRWRGAAGRPPSPAPPAAPHARIERERQGQRAGARPSTPSTRSMPSASCRTWSSSSISSRGASGTGSTPGTRYWVLFGLGALVGPMLAGALADRIGFGPALRAGLRVQAAAVLVPAISTGSGALAASSLIIGAFVPAIVPLVLGRMHELIPGGADRRGTRRGAAPPSPSPSARRRGPMACPSSSREPAATTGSSSWARPRSPSPSSST